MQIHVCSLRAVQIKQHVWSDDAKNRIKRAFEWVESIKLQLNYLCDTVWQKPTGVDVHTVISSMPLIFGHWTTTTLEERIIIIWSWPLADMRTVTVLVLCCAHEPPNADQWIRSSPSEFLIVCVGVCVCVCVYKEPTQGPTLKIMLYSVTSGQKLHKVTTIFMFLLQFFRKCYIIGCLFWKNIKYFFKHTVMHQSNIKRHSHWSVLQKLQNA